MMKIIAPTQEEKCHIEKKKGTFREALLEIKI